MHGNPFCGGFAHFLLKPGIVVFTVGQDENHAVAPCLAAEVKRGRFNGFAHFRALLPNQTGLDGRNKRRGNGQVVGERHKRVGLRGIHHNSGAAFVQRCQRLRQYLPRLGKSVRRRVGGEHTHRNIHHKHHIGGGHGGWGHGLRKPWIQQGTDCQCHG